MMAAMDQGANLSSLRLAVSAGETLPGPVFEDWTRKTGKPILDGIGSTELLHIFITNRIGDAVPGATGRPVAGYEAKIVDSDMKDVPDGTIGRLAVRGPTGCGISPTKGRKTMSPMAGTLPAIHLCGTRTADSILLPATRP